MRDYLAPLFGHMLLLTHNLEVEQKELAKTRAAGSQIRKCGVHD